MKTLKELREAARLAKESLEAAEKAAFENQEEGAKSYLEKQIEAKTADFEQACNEYDAEERRLKREERVGKMAVESKTDKVADVQIPASEHNAVVEQKKLDSISAGYLLDPSYKAEDFMSKTARRDERAIDALRVSGMDGLRIPSYLRNYVVNPIRGKGRDALEAALGAKTEYSVLVSDDSGSQSGGGSLVPETFIPELYKLPQITFRLVDLCRVKMAVGREAMFPRLTQSTNRYGVVAAWGSEGGTVATSNPVFNELSVSTGRLALLTQLSLKEMRVNRVGLEAELAWMFRGAWNEQVTKAILQGSAANNRPTGVNTTMSIALGVTAVARETSSQVSYTDLVNLMFSVEAALTENGIFVMKSGSTGAAKYISALDDTNGRPVLRNEFVGWQEGLPGQLLGRPWYMTPDNDATIGKRGDVIYGDFSNYGVAVDNDLTIERSDHFAFDTGLATYRMHSYIGGAPLGPGCFSVLSDISGVSSSSSSSST